MKKSKKLLTIMLVIAMACTSLSMQSRGAVKEVQAEETMPDPPAAEPTAEPSVAPKNNGIMGDINQDGMLGFDDVQEMLKVAIGIKVCESDVVDLADLDDDGRILLNDTRVLFNCIIGKKTYLNIDNIQINLIENLPVLNVNVISNISGSITCEVSAEDNSNLALFDYILVYDTNVLDCESYTIPIKEEYVYTNTGWVADCTADDYDWITIAGYNPKDTWKWSGIIENITFTVKEGKNIADAEPFMLIPNGSVYKGDFSDAKNSEDTVMIDIPALETPIPSVQPSEDPISSEEPTPSIEPGKTPEVSVEFDSTAHGSVTTEMYFGFGAKYTLYEDGTLYIYENTGDIWGSGVYYGATSKLPDEYKDKVTSVFVENGITLLSASSFSEYDNLESIVIPQTITSGLDNIFDTCDKFTTIKGYAGSYAETYAKENGYEFIALVENPTEPVKDKTFYDIDGTEGISLTDAQAILKRVLKITPSDVAYKLADVQKCLKIALKIETLE